MTKQTCYNVLGLQNVVVTPLVIILTGVPLHDSGYATRRKHTGLLVVCRH